jgi:small subunit ribosomal protein S21
MIEVKLEDGDKIDWALKTFKKKVMKSGILKELRKRRHYVKPSEARQLKAAAARHRGRPKRPAKPGASRAR